MARPGQGITVTGLRELSRRFDAMPEEVEKVGARQLVTEGERIMGEAKELAPVVDGALRGSGNVQLKRVHRVGVTVEIGFGGPAVPYALAVHENPRAGKTGGISPSGKRYPPGTFSTVGQWKYLETPFKKHATQIPERLARAVEKEFKRRGPTR